MGCVLAEPFSTFLSSVGKITELILICFNMLLLILLDTQRLKKIQNYTFPYILVIVILFWVFGLNFAHSPDGQIEMNDVWIITFYHELLLLIVLKSLRIGFLRSGYIAKDMTEGKLSKNAKFIWILKNTIFQ